MRFAIWVQIVINVIKKRTSKQQQDKYVIPCDADITCLMFAVSPRYVMYFSVLIYGLCVTFLFLPWLDIDQLYPVGYINTSVKGK